MRRLTKPRRVAVYRAEVLPISETFIKKQLCSLSAWKGILIGRKRLTNGLGLSGLCIKTVRSQDERFASRLVWLFLRTFGLAALAEAAWLRRVECSLFHVHFGVDAVDIWPSLCRLNVPVVVTLHGYDVNKKTEWWQSGLGGERHRNYHERLVEMAGNKNVNFIAVSAAIKRKAILLGLPEGKIRILHIGVDTGEFVPGPLPIEQRPLRILFVGRLVEKKGCEVLLRAMHRVQKLVPAADLQIIGDGPLREKCQALASELGVRANFLGSQPSSRIGTALGEARVFCLPSITASDGDAEGLPIVLLEAQACAVPVVTSAIGGREDGIIEGKTGLAFEEGDESTLADHLITLLTDTEKLRMMSNNAVAFVKDRFEISACTEHLEEYYDELVREEVLTPDFHSRAK